MWWCPFVLSWGGSYTSLPPFPAVLFCLQFLWRQLLFRGDWMPSLPPCSIILQCCDYMHQLSHDKLSNGWICGRVKPSWGGGRSKYVGESSLPDQTSLSLNCCWKIKAHNILMHAHVSMMHILSHDQDTLYFLSDSIVCRCRYLYATTTFPLLLSV